MESIYVWHQNGGLSTFFEDRTIVPTARENLLSSLRIFTDCNTQEQCRGYALGAKAYETWINGLRDKKWYEKQNTLSC